MPKLYNVIKNKDMLIILSALRTNVSSREFVSIFIKSTTKLLTVERSFLVFVVNYQRATIQSKWIMVGYRVFLFNA